MGPSNDYVKAWIDYNGDQDFTDREEEIDFGNYTTVSSGNHTFATSFIVPANAILNQTRMRVTIEYNNPPEPCASFMYGEVEDYTVAIVAANTTTTTTSSTTSTAGSSTTTIGGSTTSTSSASSTTSTTGGTTTTSANTTSTTGGSTTTSSGATTTTTLSCRMAGDYTPCNTISLSEVVDLINKWASDQAELSEVVALINAWASG